MINVHILVYDGVDEFDLCGPYEVLASCHRIFDGRWSDTPVFRVETVAEKDATIRCAHGLLIVPDKLLSQSINPEILIIPGGPGAQKEHPPKAIIDYIQETSETAEITASICTGVFLLGKAGLIDHHRVTTHAARCEALARMYPHTFVVQGQRVVTDGRDKNLMTCGGISAGVDLGLALILRYEGKDTAMLASRRIEWPLAPAAAT